MSRLEESLQQAIQALQEGDRFQRRIARGLSFNQDTVAGYVHALQQAISTPGTECMTGKPVLGLVPRTWPPHVLQTPFAKKTGLIRP